MGRQGRGGTVTLKHLHTVRKPGGRLYRYLRRPGQPLVRLPDLPPEHPDFLAAYAAAMRASPERRAAAAPGSMAALVEACLASPPYLACRPGYRALLRRHLDAIREAFGALPASGLRDRHVTADAHKASDPIARFKAWRFLGRWARRAGLLPSDPTKAAEAPPRAATLGHEPWTEDELAAYRARWPMGTVARAAMELLHWTGARIGDGVLVGPQHVGRDGVLAFRQSKTGDVAYVPWTCALPDYARAMKRDRALMHEALAALGREHLTFLAAHGQTRSDKALGTLIVKAARAAGVRKSAHGLRKSRAKALAEAGATAHQIAAWTGHKSLREVQHYTESADRRRAVQGAGSKRSRPKLQTVQK